MSHFVLGAKRIIAIISVGILSWSGGAPHASAQSAPPVAEPVILSQPPGLLAGTLLVPRADTPIPVVLLVAGSGPTNRDGNGPGTRSASLKQLAESLATRAVATLRFDKRGIGGSTLAAIPEAQLTFEQLADDVAGWIRQLTADRRFSRVIVAGHSEGALLGMLALRRVPVAGYVSVAGLARAADAALHDQIAQQLPPSLLMTSDSILARLKRGVTTDSTPPMLAGIFRPSVQPYMITWFRYSGQAEIAKVSVPCLIVQGTHDLQVATSEADLLAKANPRCEVVRIEGMNHALKLTPADLQGQLPSYQTPDAPLSPVLVDALASFANGRRTRL